MLLWASLAVVLVVIVITATVVILVLLVDKGHRRPGVIRALVPVLVALVSATDCRASHDGQLEGAQAHKAEDQ